MNQQVFLPIGTQALQRLGQPHTLFTTLTRITVQWWRLLTENDTLTKITVNLKALCYVDDNFVNPMWRYEIRALAEKMLKGEALGSPEPFEQYTSALQGLKSPPTKMPLDLPHSHKLFCREEEQQQVVSGALLPLVFIAFHLRCHIQRVPFQSHILKTLLLPTSWGSVPLPRWPRRGGHRQPRTGTALLSPARHIWWTHHWLMYLTATGLTQTTPPTQKCSNKPSQPVAEV